MPRRGVRRSGVSQQFFSNYRKTFNGTQRRLREAHLREGAEGAQNYAHTPLKRIMFLYLIGCKGWLLGTVGELGRDFMRHFWEAYRQEDKKRVSTGVGSPCSL